VGGEYPLSDDKKPEKPEIPDDYPGMIVDAPEEDPETFGPVTYGPPSDGNDSEIEEPLDTWDIDGENFTDDGGNPPAEGETPSSPYPPELAGLQPEGPPTTTNPTDSNDIMPVSIPDPNYPDDVDLGKFDTWPQIVLPNDLMDLQLTGDMYPQEGYLPKYIRWSEGTTDAPRPFHLIAGLATLSAALGPNWQADFAGGQNVNFYALLIAGSGSRKSTALRRALDLIPNKLICTSSLASTPAFVKHLQDRPRMLWYLDEADSLFHTFQQKLGSDLGSRMVTAYDCESTIYSSLTQGDIIAPNPYPTLVTGTALEWLKERKLSSNLLRGGLISRFWLIPAKRTRLLLQPPKPDKQVFIALKKFIDDVYRISELGLTFDVQFSPDALKLFLQYQAGRGNPPHADMTGVWNRSMDHIAKIALLFHVSSFRRGKDRIQEDSVRQALNLWHNFLLRGHYWAVMNLVSTDDPVAEYEQEILTRLEMTPSRSCPLSVLNSGRGFKIREALFNLYLRRRILFWACRNKGKGRPSYIVTLGQKPEGFVQCEKRLPTYFAKKLEESGFEPDEFDLPLPSEWVPPPDIQPAKVKQFVLADLLNRPDKLLEANGWYLWDYLDEDGQVELWMLEGDDLMITGVWNSDEETFSVDKPGTILIPNTTYSLVALLTAFQNTDGLVEPTPVPEEVPGEKADTEPPETWDIQPMEEDPDTWVGEGEEEEWVPYDPNDVDDDQD
jgi:hypothetical protein